MSKLFNASIIVLSICIVSHDTLASDTLSTDVQYQKAINLPREADPKLSPGVARENLSRDEICNTKWGKDERSVTESMKRQVYANYGVTVLKNEPFPHYTVNGKSRPLYEVDHVWSRELGGADDIKNLALQSYVGDCNAHDKDRLENAIHVDLCAPGSTLSLSDARNRLNHWIAEYERRYGSCKHG